MNRLNRSFRLHRHPGAHVAIAALLLPLLTGWLTSCSGCRKPQSAELTYRGKPLSEWVEMLGSGSGRLAAVDALAAIGDPAVPALLATIKDPAKREGAAPFAAIALARMGEPGISVLSRTLKDADPATRSVALLAFSTVDPLPQQAIVAISAAATDQDPRVRELATLLLAQAGQAGLAGSASNAQATIVPGQVLCGGKAAAQWIDDLDSPDIRRRGDARTRLAELGERALPCLLEMKAANPVGDVGAFVDMNLRPNDAAVVGAAIQALKHNEAAVRAQAARLLNQAAMLKAVPEGALVVLQEAQGDPDPEVRQYSKLALLSMGRPADPITGEEGRVSFGDGRGRFSAPSEYASPGDPIYAGYPASLWLARLLEPADPYQQRRAADVLRDNLGPQATAILPGLAKGLAHADPYVRRKCAYNLYLIGTVPEEAVAPLAKNLSDPDQGVRLFSAMAAEVAPASALTALRLPLTNALRDKDAEVRKYASEALQKLETAVGSAASSKGGNKPHPISGSAKSRNR